MCVTQKNFLQGINPITQNQSVRKESDDNNPNIRHDTENIRIEPTDATQVLFIYYYCYKLLC
jgi:hypothetical protein